MKKAFHLNTSFVVSLFSAFLLLGSSFTLAAKPGTASANFLKIGVGARGAAMADAQSAITEDVTSLYWNPAGLSRIRFKELNVMHYGLVEGVKYNQASFALPTDKKGVFAFGVNHLDYGDIDGFDNTSAPTGSVDASNLLLSAGWARPFSKDGAASYGVTLKYLQSDLAGFKASAPMLDLGVQYPLKTDRLEGLSLAAGIRNLGPSIEYDSESVDLPQQIVLGAGLKALGGNLNLDLDFIQPNDNDAYMAAGVEYRVFQMLKLRAGYNGVSEFVGNGITYGMGLEFTSWALDYAFVPQGDLGDTNRVSVTVKFGRAAEIRSAEAQVEMTYKRARRQLALGNGVEAYATVIDLLLVAPWYQPAVELKEKIEKRFAEMETSKSKIEMESQISKEFTKAKAAFDRDELVAAKKGFTAILALQEDHVGSQVYLERIKNRYASLAQESFKQGMDAFAAGDYEQAKIYFEKSLTIDEYNADARAQLARTNELLADRTKRLEEIKRLAGAADSYKEGLKLYQEQKWEEALKRFEKVQEMSPDYEENNRYYNLTVKTLANELFAQSKIDLENGDLKDAETKLTRAAALQPEDDRIRQALKVAQRDLSVQNARESQRLYREGLESYLNGKTDKAESLWKQALELDPRNEDALKALTKLEEQRAYESQAE